MLTKPGDHLIETQVLEVYDELSMNKDKTYKVELEGNSGGPTLVKLNENEEKESMEEAGKKERLQLKLVDMGEMNFLLVPNGGNSVCQFVCDHFFLLRMMNDLMV